MNTTSDIGSFYLTIGLLVVVWIAVKVYMLIRWNRLMRALELSGVDEMSGRQFEQYISWLGHQRGYNVDTTPDSHDLGVDLIAHDSGSRVVAQCKRSGSRVGRRAVSDAHAATSYYKASGSMVVPNSWFSSDAVKLAHACGTVLIGREQLGKWISELQPEAVPESAIFEQ